MAPEKCFRPTMAKMTRICSGVMAITAWMAILS